MRGDQLTWHVLAYIVPHGGDTTAGHWPLRGRAFMGVVGWARHGYVRATGSALAYAQRVFRQEPRVAGVAFEIYQTCPRCGGTGVEPGRKRATCRGDGCPGPKAPWPGLLSAPRGFYCLHTTGVPVATYVGPYGPAER